MMKFLSKLPFLGRKAHWIGWFVIVHLLLSFAILILLISLGINPTLLVSVLGAPLWIGVAFSSKYITDKIMEN